MIQHSHTLSPLSLWVWTGLDWAGFDGVGMDWVGFRWIGLVYPSSWPQVLLVLCWFRVFQVFLFLSVGRRCFCLFKIHPLGRRCFCLPVILATGAFVFVSLTRPPELKGCATERSSYRPSDRGIDREPERS